MPRHHKKHSMRSKRMLRSKRTKRTLRRMRGGAGAGYEPGAALVPGMQLGEQIHQRYDGCMTVDRPGQMSYSPTGGLPGMRGGGYTTNLSSGLPGFAQIDKLPCYPPLTGFNKHFTQAGGVGLKGAADMGVYVAPTAGYTQTAGSVTDSVGAPLLLNQPYDARMMSRACVQTAGNRRRHRRSHSKKSKKSGRRKQRGGGLK